MKRLLLSILLLLPVLASAATVRVRDLPVVTNLYDTNLVMVVTGTTNALASPQTVVAAAWGVTNGQADVTLTAPTFVEAITLDEGMITADSGGFYFNLPVVFDAALLTNFNYSTPEFAAAINDTLPGATNPTEYSRGLKEMYSETTLTYFDGSGWVSQAPIGLPILSSAPTAAANCGLLWISNSASPTLYITTTNGTFPH